MVALLILVQTIVVRVHVGKQNGAVSKEIQPRFCF